ncbi:MAG: hypothetical protein ACYCS8_19015 [Acidithiobacillus sp.]
MIKFNKAEKLGGKTSYIVMRHASGEEPKMIAFIRYFDKHDVVNTRRLEGVGWALLYVTGRSEAYDTLQEAKDAALKI